MTLAKMVESLGAADLIEVVRVATERALELGQVELLDALAEDPGRGTWRRRRPVLGADRAGAYRGAAGRLTVVRQQMEFTWRRRRPRRRASTLRSEDGPRLAAQRGRVLGLMADGGWRSLADIAAATASPEASASARLRQLRAAGHVVERRREGDPRTGAWRYRLRPVGGGR